MCPFLGRRSGAYEKEGGKKKGKEDSKTKDFGYRAFPSGAGRKKGRVGASFESEESQPVIVAIFGPRANAFWGWGEGREPPASFTVYEEK